MSHGPPTRTRTAVPERRRELDIFEERQILRARERLLRGVEAE